MSGKATVLLEDMSCAKDPVFEQTTTGKEKVKFSVALSKRKKVNDEWEGPSMWFNCSSFDLDVIDKVRALVHKGTKGLNITAYADIFVGRDGQTLCDWKVTDISLADGQTAHGTAKANGYAPEPPDDGLHSQVMQASGVSESGEDDADIPF